jgi:hypothetical protein
MIGLSLDVYWCLFFALVSATAFTVPKKSLLFLLDLRISIRENCQKILRVFLFTYWWKQKILLKLRKLNGAKIFLRVNMFTNSINQLFSIK